MGISMRNIFIGIMIAAAVSSCKKEELGYFPKQGQSFKIVKDNWGDPDQVIYIAPSFNDDTKNIYKYHSATVFVSNNIVVKISTK